MLSEEGDDMSEGKDYARLIAAQNEAQRRLKIKSISNTLTEENKKKNQMAIVSGICFSGLLAAVHFSGIDYGTALETEIKALNSFESLKDYLSLFTPAAYGAMIATAASFHSFLRHKRRYDRANQEFYDMMDTQPEGYQDIVETQAKTK